MHMAMRRLSHDDSDAPVTMQMRHRHCRAAGTGAAQQQQEEERLAQRPLLKPCIRRYRSDGAAASQRRSAPSTPPSARSTHHASTASAARHSTVQAMERCQTHSRYVIYTTAGRANNAFAQVGGVVQ